MKLTDFEINYDMSIQTKSWAYKMNSIRLIFEKLNLQINTRNIIEFLKSMLKCVIF